MGFKISTNDNWLNSIQTLRNELRAVSDNHEDDSVENRLHEAVENLEIYQEELRAQNEALISAREESEALLKRYSVLFECSPVGYFIIDQNSSILECNLRGAEMLGHSQIHLTGKPLFLYANPAYRRMLEAHFRQVFRGGNVSDEINFIGPAGEQFPVLINSTSLGDSISKEARCLTAIFDISERKIAEDALVSARDEAEIANRTKSEFLAIMAHELRTPLNAIIGFSDLIQQQSFGPVQPEKYQEYINLIHNSGVDMLGLINNLLDLGKAESGRMEVFDAELKVDELVHSAMVLVGERANAAGVTLNVEIKKDMPKIRADARLFKQMILNLLTNAIKFSDDGGEITISAMLGKRHAITLSVSDNGVGIAREDIPKILLRYGQVGEKQVKHNEGTGLGLPIVAEMMELHDGKLEIESQIGEGTTVSLLFPPERTLFKTN